MAPVQVQTATGWAAIVRRAKEALGLGVHELLLHPGRRRAREVGEVVLVVAVGREGSEDLLAADEPRRLAVAQPLGHLGKGHADAAHPGERIGALGRHRPVLPRRRLGASEPR